MHHQPYDPAAVAAAKRRRGRRILLAVVIPFGGLIVLATLANIGAPDDDKADDPPAATVPAYEITKQETTGNTRNVTVEVDSTKGLEAVFNDVARKLTDEAGYFVQIDCATVGADKSAARLANGKVAVGNMGAAATGLDEGETEFAALDGRSCPAT
ncbi:hypothetical protein ACIQ6R_18075 [Streptomyces sp. NPDC096048]|uniref:hypothetical protein n=1 Tax=Streptomyces sp. NPDC096048 TaxID=3366072 RepID=UPI003814F47B